MKLFFRIFKFASPVGKYAIPYFICVLIYAIFNTFNFVMIMPILDALFHKGIDVRTLPTSMPDFALTADYLNESLNYLMYKYFGHDGGLDIKKILVILSGVLITSMFISNLSRYLSQKIMANFGIHTLKKIRDALFTNIMKLSVGFFSNSRKGDVLSRLNSDIGTVQFIVTNTIQVMFREPLLIISYFIGLIGISFKLTVFTILVLPITALVIGFIVKRLRHYAHHSQEAIGEMLAISDEAISGIKVVKSYNITDYITQKYIDKGTFFSNVQRKMASRQQLASPVSEFLGVIAVTIILIYGGGLVADGQFEASAFIAYIGIFSQVTRPVRAITDSFSSIHQGLAAGERVMEYMDLKPEIVDDPSKTKLVSFEDKIEFKNVHFSYGDKEVIKGINFTINKGETVALVGSSGGGKSTITDLLCRFYDVKSGSIEIDGVDIKDYYLSSLRDHVGTVSQDVVLFNDTIKSNIGMGKLGSADEEIMAAAKIANAHEFITNSPKGYDTNIGDRGAKLSGGQRQRLSIARAVLKNPDILILDEATSALDTQSEQTVQLALNSLLYGRTSLVVAHRLSTIQNADKILVIEDGYIVETGAHAELIAQGGIYKTLIDIQKFK